MKILSETIEEGRVIELTRAEWREFQILAQAVEGKSANELHSLRMVEDRSFRTEDAVIDLSGVFGVILAFYRSKFAISEMQRLVDLLKRSVDGTPK